jgi:hypothetical protein
MRERSELVEKGNPKVSVRKQCKLLSVARSSVDYQRVGESLRIPAFVGHPFRFYSDSDSDSIRTPIPIDIGQ